LNKFRKTKTPANVASVSGRSLLERWSEPYKVFNSEGTTPLADVGQQQHIRSASAPFIAL
jgi:hypothetical protein